MAADIFAPDPVKGLLSNNNAAPASDLIGALTAVVSTAAPTLTNGNLALVSLDTSGNLRVTDGSTATRNVNVAQVNGNTVNTGNGAAGTGTQRVVIASDQTAFSVNAIQSGTWTVQPGNTANTTPWLTTINQGGNSATVKAASTPAVATDPALVVAISPNNSITVDPMLDTTNTGTLNALNAAVSVSVNNQLGVAIQIAAGTLIGTIVPEISVDGGTTWVTTQFDDPVTNTKTSSITFATANTATTRTIITAGGTSTARVRVSAFTSGTANASIRASQARDPSLLFTAPAGSTSLPPVIGHVGGTVSTAAPTYTNGTLNTFSLTTAGAVRTDGSGTTQPISGTVTVTQATAANLQAQVQGTSASGSAKSGNPVQLGGVFNTTQPTVTTGQVVELQASSRGAIIIATGTETPTSNQTQIAGTSIAAGAGATTAGTQRVVIANDQVLPVSRTTASNSVTNTIFVQPSNGTTTVAFNAGATDTATQRVVLGTTTGLGAVVTTPIFSQLSNGTTSAAFNAGAADTATLRVVLASGTGLGTSATPLYVTSDDPSGTPKISNNTTADIATNGGTQTSNSTAISNGTTGRLLAVTAGGNTRMRHTVQRFDGTTATTVANFLTQANDSVTWKVQDPASVSQTGNGTTTTFRCVSTNLDNVFATPAYVVFEWTEV